VQKRVSITASVLASMRTVKMMGLSRILTTLIQNERVEETHRMAHFRWSIVAQNMVQNLPWFVAPALTFVIYVAQAKVQGKPSINTTQAFTALSIITLLTAPAAGLLSALVSTAASVGCFDRIQLFLLAAPRNDQRSATTCSTTLTSVAGPANFQDGNVEMTDFAQDSCKNGSDPTVAIAATRLSVRPNPSADLILADINFTIPAKSLTMIIGPVASGKTTLLRTMLGEIQPEDGGSIGVASRRIAYAAQNPWLPNTSVRNAIIGPTDMEVKFDHSWYSKTIYACALDHDLGLLQDGDETRIGDAGASLSGGQKHRVALARAVYSQAPIILLDNVIAALDINTQATVMSRLFGESGLLRRSDTTVVFIVNACRFYCFHI
jgi:ATP-binding cassette, subfamily C (CFTR/MRP), member 1